VRQELRSKWFGYFVAVVATAGAILVRWVTDPWLNQQLRIGMMYGAIALGAYVGGFGPGLLATLLGYAVSAYIFIEPHGSFIHDRDAWVGFGLYLATNLLILLLMESLRRAQQRARHMALIVESSEDAIVGKDLSGRITSWNQGAERLYGYTSGEVLGKSVSVLFPPGRSEELAEFLERLKRGVRIETYETVRIRKDGQPISVSIGVFPVRNEVGTLIGGSAIARDLREAKKQEERLQLLSETAAGMLRAENPDAMLRDLFAKIRGPLRLDTYFNFMVNEPGDALRLESYAGITPEAAEGVGRLQFDQEICGQVALERRPIVRTHIQDAQDSRALLVKSFGIRVYACNPLLAGDKLLGTLSFASRTRDTFDPAELEFLKTVSNYVAVAYERIRWVGQLREADRRKDEFLATLAHELRNPLAPIRNAIQILKAKGPPEPELVWGREVIDRQVQHMTRLLEDLLDVSRISHNKLELRREKVELAELIRHAVETSRPAIEAGGHDLTLELSREPVFINVDPVRVAQVFSNLLSNAAKYTRSGGHIRVIEERKGSDVVVTVEDDGVGISRDMLPFVFEMFSQAQRMLENSQGGLGIGLSLVRSILELHGGSIEARSDGPGTGSRFIVRLPLVVEPMLAPERSSIPESKRTETLARRILVVDDLKDSADTLALLFRAMGHHVETAYDGEAAARVAHAFRPEIVLLDIGMPKMNGYEVCRNLRATNWGASVYLVALTGWGQNDDRARTEEAGFDAHLVKPADPETLIRLVDSVPRWHETPTVQSP